MKKMWVIAAIVCAALMVACGGEKKSEKSGDLEAISSKDLVGTWKIVIKENKEVTLTLNEDGKGDFVTRSGEYVSVEDIHKWMYDNSNNTITIIWEGNDGEDVIDFVIIKRSIDGNKLVVDDSVNEDILLTMTRVK